MTFFYRGNAAAADEVLADRPRRRAQASPRCRSTSATPRRARPRSKAIAERCGRIDILVNNAGTIRDNPLAAFDDDDVAVVLDTNVTGVFNVTRAVVPYMISQRAGRIVNISSVAGEKGGRGPDQLRGEQGRDQRLHARARGRARAAQDQRQLRRAGRHRHGNVEGRARDGGRRSEGAHPAASATAGRKTSRSRSGFSFRRTADYVTGQVFSGRRRIQNGMKGATKMTQAQITKEEIAAVLPTVSATIADALGCDVEEVTPDASLIDDLDAESIDFLDMVFRLERAFKIKIPRGKIVENARGTLTGGRIRAERHRHRSRSRAAPRISVGSARRALPDADEGQGHPAPLHDGDLLQARHRGAARGEGR